MNLTSSFPAGAPASATDAARARSRAIATGAARVPPSVQRPSAKAPVDVGYSGDRVRLIVRTEEREIITTFEKSLALEMAEGIAVVAKALGAEPRRRTIGFRPRR